MADLLMCMEPPTPPRAFEDPVLLNDDRVLENLLSAEEHYVPQMSYFKCVQTDIQPYMRRVVTEWMQEVCEEQHSDAAVFSLSVNYMDRYLCLRDIHRTRLQCLGAACIFLASKLRDNKFIHGDRLVMYTDYSITLQDLMEMESMVLQVLKWDMSAVTPHDFVSYIIHRLDMDPRDEARMKRNAESYVKYCAIESKFMLYTPSMIAAGCICVALQRMETPYALSILMQKLHEVTGIDLEVLTACQESMHLAVVEREVQLRADVSDNVPHVEMPVKETHPFIVQSTTPTDVRDINLLKVDKENCLVVTIQG